MNDTPQMTSSRSYFSNSSFSNSPLSSPISQIAVFSKDVDEPGGPTNHPHCHRLRRHHISSIHFHPLPLCAQDRRNSPRKIDPFLAQQANDHPENRNPIPETESTSATEGSAIPRSLMTPTLTTTIADTTAETTTTTSIESSPASSVTIIPTRTPPLTLTEEDKIIFDNLNILLFELLVTIYHEHLRLRHYTRR